MKTNNKPFADIGTLNEPIRLMRYETPMGTIAAGAVSKGICLLEFTSNQEFEALARRFGNPVDPKGNSMLLKLKSELDFYFSGKLKTFTVPLVYQGTGFQTAVWDELRKIPWGETRSYEDIAKAAGNPSAVRAVGNANGLNPIAIIIPCHRVIRKNGNLGGYGGGIEKKKFLLELEKRPI